MTWLLTWIARKGQPCWKLKESRWLLEILESVTDLESEEKCAQLQHGRVATSLAVAIEFSVPLILYVNHWVEYQYHSKYPLHVFPARDPGGSNPPCCTSWSWCTIIYILYAPFLDSAQ